MSKVKVNTIWLMENVGDSLTNSSTGDTVRFNGDRFLYKYKNSQAPFTMSSFEILGEEWEKTKNPYKEFCTTQELRDLGITLNKDDKVIVSNSETTDFTTKRYLQKSQHDRFICYENGKSSWTINDETSDICAWRFIKLVKEEAIEQPTSEAYDDDDCDSWDDL